MRKPPPVFGKPPTKQAAVVDGKRLLASVTTGLVREPLSLLVYGVEGVGKTSFAAGSPKPLLIGAENGSAEIGNVARYSPKCLDDVTAILEALRTEEHGYQTVAIDSLDWLEPLIHEHVWEVHGKATIEAFGYGKGYAEAMPPWRSLVKQLDVLRTKGMNVVLVSHSVCKSFKNPNHDQDDYDRYSLKIHDKVAGLVKEWSKAVLFANFERSTVEKNNRVKGVDTGRRLLYTRMTAAFDAKNRLWLPEEIPLGWSPFQRAVDAGRALMARYYAAVGAVSEERRALATEEVERSNYDPTVVESVIEGLKEGR